MKVVVIGGAGHIGLPLSIALADASDANDVVIYDIDPEAVEMVNAEQLPFREIAARPRFERVLGANLSATTDPRVIQSADALILVIGTPIDRHLNPAFNVFRDMLEELMPYFRDGQTVILRSTVYPGTSQRVKERLESHGLKLHVSFCPERIAEGEAMTELYNLPQLVSGFDKRALDVARDLFSLLTKELIELSPMEAELAKLFANSWRYIQFATANQYYMLAESKGLDFHKIHHAITHHYPRAAGFPRAGFAAGPCLLKDTMQLSAFSGNQFFLGHSAMLINEEMPQFIVQQLKQKMDLRPLTVGILGMAFKSESDDKRDSLSYKLKRILEFEANQVLCTDEFIKDDRFLPLETVLRKADVLILAAPHKRYRSLSTTKTLVDIWNWSESASAARGTA